MPYPIKSLPYLSVVDMLRCTDDRRYQIQKFPFDNPHKITLNFSLMDKVKKPKSWAEQLADLDNPAPKG